MQTTGLRSAFARQQTLAILDTNSGVLEERVLEHDDGNVASSTARSKQIKEHIIIR